MRGAGLEGNFIGAAGELRVAAELVKRGCTVFVPVVGCTEVDLIAMNEQGQTYRIQVKRPYLRSRIGPKRRTEIRMRMTRSGNKKYRHVDFFIGVYEESYWIFPATETSRTPTLNVKRGRQWLEAWHLIAGSNEKHEVKIEQTQPNLYAVSA